jgi:hypothetical protein
VPTGFLSPADKLRALGIQPSTAATTLTANTTATTSTTQRMIDEDDDEATGTEEAAAYARLMEQKQRQRLLALWQPIDIPSLVGTALHDRNAKSEAAGATASAAGPANLFFFVLVSVDNSDDNDNSNTNTGSAAAARWLLHKLSRGGRSTDIKKQQQQQKKKAAAAAAAVAAVAKAKADRSRSRSPLPPSAMGDDVQRSDEKKPVSSGSLSVSSPPSASAVGAASENDIVLETMSSYSCQLDYAKVCSCFSFPRTPNKYLSNFFVFVCLCSFCVFAASNVARSRESFCVGIRIIFVIVFVSECNPWCSRCRIPVPSGN